MSDKKNNFNRWWVVTLISLTTLVFGIGASWGILKNSLNSKEKINARQDIKLNEHETRLRQAEIQQAGIRSDIKALRKGQDEIKELIKSKE